MLEAGEFLITDSFGGLPEEQLELDREKARHNAEVLADLKPRSRRHIHVHLGDQ